MSNLGKCLLFNLKYPAEMQRLYWSDEPNCEGLPEPDRILEKIRTVGDAAGREAAELLELCASGIEKHFSAISKIERRRTNLEKNWELEFRIWSKRATNRHFTVGVTIDEHKATLSSWVWCPGGRRAEDSLLRILGCGTKSVAGWYTGNVRLAELSIPVPERLEDQVPYEALIAQIHGSFTSFTQREIKAIAALANVRGEP